MSPLGLAHPLSTGALRPIRLIAGEHGCLISPLLSIRRQPLYGLPLICGPGLDNAACSPISNVYPDRVLPLVDHRRAHGRASADDVQADARRRGAGVSWGRARPADSRGSRLAQPRRGAREQQARGDLVLAPARGGLQRREVRLLPQPAKRGNLRRRRGSGQMQVVESRLRCCQPATRRQS